VRARTERGHVEPAAGAERAVQAGAPGDRRRQVPVLAVLSRAGERDRLAGSERRAVGGRRDGDRRGGGHGARPQRGRRRARLAMTSAIRASPVCPLASVTRAMIVWSPWLRLPAVIVAPLPRLPSRSELHTTRAPRSPLSASTAVAPSVTAVPRSMVAFGTGA